jgi:hypothetical protein
MVSRFRFDEADVRIPEAEDLQSRWEFHQYFKQQKENVTLKVQ